MFWVDRMRDKPLILFFFWEKQRNINNYYIRQPLNWMFLCFVPKYLFYIFSDLSVDRGAERSYRNQIRNAL